MQPSSTPPVEPPHQRGRSGLRDPHRRTLMRIIFTVTALVLLPFAVLQFRAGNLVIATVELSGVLALGIAAFRIGASPYLRRWILVYLLLLFSFLFVIMMVPHASTDTAYVWVFAMPVLAYLLLGRWAGLALTAPFMLAIAIYHGVKLGIAEEPLAIIGSLNPIACGLVILLFIHIYETMRSEAEEALVAQAETDSLTGLPNRSSFQSTFERVLNESRRSRASFALVLLDIDHFKNINDTLGHDAGDTALQALASCLNQRLRSTDFVGRLGGEEFGLLLRDLDSDGARLLVDELRRRVAGQDICYSDRSFRLTVTLGIASWPRDGDSTTSLYQVADRRMYAGKHAGRNTIVCDGYTIDISAEAGKANPDGSPRPAD